MAINGKKEEGNKKGQARKKAGKCTEEEKNPEGII